MTLTFGSLFAGIGGFDLGFERAGMACKWQVEIDDKCRQVLAYHWPDVDRSVTDVTAAGKRNLEPVDVICGGFPCQDVSVAGKREGLSGKRSGLWFQFHRVLAELKPRWVVVENVPGLLSSNGGRDFAAILRGLVKLGYGVCWRVLDAQFAGVPQRRRRVFIVGSLGGGRAAEVLFESEGSAWNPAPSREAGERVTGSLAPGAHPGGITQQEVSSGGNDGGFRTGPGEHVVIALDWQSGGDVRLNISDEHTSALQASQTPAIAFIAGGFGVRRLTPRECERLQGFPDDWTLVGDMKDSPRYRMLGNAVAVPCAGWIGRRIMEVEAQP